jgi:diguanylate cyclase (GGDEF)-like protein/PAS domain S-box-containing protein
VRGRKRIEEALKESEERYRAVVERSVEAIYLFDPETKRVLETNAAFEDLLGYAADELLDMKIYDFVAHVVGDIDMNVKRHLIEEKRFVGERKYHRKGGRLLEVEVSATLVPYDGKESVCCVVRDITGRKALEDQLARQAFHDSLTDLPNRALFLDRLGHTLARARRGDGQAAVLFVDLDDFKIVNDSLGHESGDRLLTQVAERLRSCMRPGDTVARLFGDEFAVLLESSTAGDEGQMVAARVLEKLQAPFDLDGRDLRERQHRYNGLRTCKGRRSSPSPGMVRGRPAPGGPGDVHGEEARQERLRGVQPEHEHQGVRTHGGREPAQTRRGTRGVHSPLSADHRH